LYMEVIIGRLLVSFELGSKVEDVYL
jgi:hypothetical protein